MELRHRLMRHADVVRLATAQKDPLTEATRASRAAALTEASTQVLQVEEGVVARAVVHDDDLELVLGVRARRHAADAAAHHRLLVERGDDDRHLRLLGGAAQNGRYRIHRMPRTSVYTAWMLAMAPMGCRAVARRVDVVRPFGSADHPSHTMLTRTPRKGAKKGAVPASAPPKRCSRFRAVQPTAHRGQPWAQRRPSHRLR